MNASPKWNISSITKADTQPFTDSKMSGIRSLFSDENDSENFDYFKLYVSLKKGYEIKPSLNNCESKNLMFSYSKSRRFKEDTIFFSSLKPVVAHTQEESQKLAFKDKIDELIRQLPVPIEKKNDENFKLKAIKKMRKEKHPPNQSAKKSDIMENSHQKVFRIGI